MKIAAKQGDISYYPDFIRQSEAYEYFRKLQQLRWQQDNIVIYGKTMPIPRLQAWYGDEGVSYGYSNLQLTNLHWTHELLTLKRLIENKLSLSFNSVLANYYRDQQDTVNWHSDDEPELGLNPVIASLSFGGERDFHLKHKETKETLKLTLKPGSLLVMAGETQHYWQHCVPRTKSTKAPRINLTFRRIF